MGPMKWLIAKCFRSQRDQQPRAAYGGPSSAVEDGTWLVLDAENGSCELRLRGVSTSEEAIAKIEEHLRGRRDAGDAEMARQVMRHGIV